MRYVLILAVLLPLLLLAGCGEQDFDKQYAQTEKQLKADAARLDREMAQEGKKEPGDQDQARR
jgi:outer membrane murein-binding lipoprotein Lpp